MRPATACRCSRSLGAISALFASMAVAVYLAQDACLDAGGRLSESAWTCDTATGATVSLWTMASPVALAVIAVAVGVPVYWAVNAIANRWLSALSA